MGAKPILHGPPQLHARLLLGLGCEQGLDLQRQASSAHDWGATDEDQLVHPSDGKSEVVASDEALPSSQQVVPR